MSKPRKQCIYCNADRNIDKSDIIPKSLTKKGPTYRCVCHEHNETIGNLYEDIVSKKLALLRRLYDIPSRKNNKDITYRVKLKLNENNIIEFSNFSGLAEAFWYELEGKTSNGKDVKLTISSPDKQGNYPLEQFEIEYCEYNELVKTLTDIKMYKVVAKIGYEYYCKSKGIIGHDEKHFAPIVDFILNQNNNNNMFVEVVTDWNFYNNIQNSNEYGTHILFIMETVNGNKYIIFSLWGIIIYKILVNTSLILLSNTNYNNIFAIRFDGTISHFGISKLSVCTCLQSTKSINKEILDHIHRNIREVFKYNLFTKEGKRREIIRIRKVLNSIRDIKEKMYYFVGAQDDEVITFWYIVLLLYDKRKLYNTALSLNQNIKSLLKCDEFIYIKHENYYNIVTQLGEENFIEKLINAIDFFETIKDCS